MIVTAAKSKGAEGRLAACSEYMGREMAVYRAAKWYRNADIGINERDQGESLSARCGIFCIGIHTISTYIKPETAVRRHDG